MNRWQTLGSEEAYGAGGSTSANYIARVTSIETEDNTNDVRNIVVCRFVCIKYANCRRDWSLPMSEFVKRLMSMVPLMFRDWWDDFDRPVSRIMDQHFGRVLNRDDLISRFSDLGFDRPARSMFSGRYLRPWRTVSTRQPSTGSSTIQLDNKDNFQVILDVQQFSPEEITVKTVGNNIIIEAKHEERQDEHGYVSRQFLRRYVLPPSHDVINITSSLSSDGVLTITAPKKGEISSGGERLIDIVKTGEPASKPIKVETTAE